MEKQSFDILKVTGTQHKRGDKLRDWTMCHSTLRNITVCETDSKIFLRVWILL